jgi:hypothetical protein
MRPTEVNHGIEQQRASNAKIAGSISAANSVVATLQLFN